MRITLHAKKGRLHNIDKHTGYITVWAGKNRLYSKSAGINRLNRADAHADAAELKVDLLNLNSKNEV